MIVCMRPKSVFWDSYLDGQDKSSIPDSWESNSWHPKSDPPLIRYPEDRPSIYENPFDCALSQMFILIPMNAAILHIWGMGIDFSCGNQTNLSLPIEIKKLICAIFKPYHICSVISISPSFSLLTDDLDRHIDNVNPPKWMAD